MNYNTLHTSSEIFKIPLQKIDFCHYLFYSYVKILYYVRVSNSTFSIIV